MVFKAEDVLDRRDVIERIDRHGMTALIGGVPEQWREAIEVAQSASLGSLSTPRGVIALGMGGSAIGADLVRALLAKSATVPIEVNRDYELPAWVHSDTLVIASSYSGETEETLTAVEKAARRGSPIVAITSGGRLASLASERGWPLVQIPGGLPPRAAMGYSFVPVLVLLARLGVCADVTNDLFEAGALLARQRARFGPDIPFVDNPAKQLASALARKMVLIYGSCGWKGTVAYRWKCQINENAKAPAAWNVFPEVNHNETVGWEAPQDVNRRIHLILLRDAKDEVRIHQRVELTRDIVSKALDGVSEMWAEGHSELARLMSLVYPGDWVSLYLALLYGHDPTPIAVIDHLKQRLADC